MFPSIILPGKTWAGIQFDPLANMSLPFTRKWKLLPSLKGSSINSMVLKYARRKMPLKSWIIYSFKLPSSHFPAFSASKIVFIFPYYPHGKTFFALNHSFLEYNNVSYFFDFFVFKACNQELYNNFLSAYFSRTSWLQINFTLLFTNHERI